VIVDIANGYIRLNDEGAGGGNVVTEIALFKPMSGGPILGYVQRYHSARQAQAGKARFIPPDWWPMARRRPCCNSPVDRRRRCR